MSIKDRIHAKLTENLSIQKLEVVDDSAKHAGHAGWKADGETHFNVKIVSNDFAGKSKVARHKMVYSALNEEMREKIHALSIVALTPDEELRT
jgi:BolA protein